MENGVGNKVEAEWPTANSCKSAVDMKETTAELLARDSLFPQLDTFWYLVAYMIEPKFQDGKG